MSQKEPRYIPTVIAGLSGLLLICACSAIIIDISPFGIKNVVDSVSVPIETHMFPGKYYRVKFDSVNKKFENMQYAGTEHGLNIFMVYMKAAPPGSVFRIALSDSQCKVYDARRIVDEYSKYGTSFRSAHDWRGRCLVFGDSVISRFRRNWRAREYSDVEWDSLWVKAIGDERLE
jgi:hypothetical protein